MACAQKPPEPGNDADRFTATGHERPVFLDEHGRRKRWVHALGALAGGIAALWLLALIAGAIGFATLPLPRELRLGFHHQHHHRRIGLAERRENLDVDAPGDLRLRRPTESLRHESTRA